jgi:hypothetical protein
VWVLKEAWAQALMHEKPDRRHDLQAELASLQAMAREAQGLSARIDSHIRNLNVQIREVLLEMGNTP